MVFEILSSLLALVLVTINFITLVLCLIGLVRKVVKGDYDRERFRLYGLTFLITFVLLMLIYVFKLMFS